MKVACPTDGNDLTATMYASFGRAPTFIVVDSETGSFELVDNTQNLNAAQGAGIQSAQNVAGAGAEGLITKHCGPKAFRVLDAANVKVYLSDAKTIQEALDEYKAGNLTASDGANVEGHWA